MLVKYGTARPSLDVFIPRQTHNQDIPFLLGHIKMPDMSQMNKVENAVTQDDLLPFLFHFLNDPGKFLGCFDFIRNRCQGAHFSSLTRYLNQSSVALAMVCGVQSGAWRQYSILAKIFRTPSSIETLD